MQRRDFLRAGLSLAAAGLTLPRPARAAAAEQLQIMTVGGLIPADRLGTTLVHEHVLVDFIGAEKVSRERYDRDEVVKTMLPYLRRVRSLGCRTLVECTPAYLGRDPVLLERLSRQSGLQLVTNTGYYGAVNDKFVPPHGVRESADELARRWLAEWRGGIEESGVRPGFIKIGVDPGGLSELDRKLVRAAARTHRASGLTIAAHTGDGQAALDELETLEDEGLDPSAWIWVHAQKESDASLHLHAARRGAWVEFDGVRPDTVEEHVGLVKRLKDAGLLERVLISHDAGWYHVGEPGGGEVRTYNTIFTEFVPALKESGFSDADIDRLLVVNPREAFAVRKRLAES